MSDPTQNPGTTPASPGAGCPAPGDLDAAARGSLAPEAAARLAAHLPTCAGCRELFDLMRENQSFVTRVLNHSAAPGATGAHGGRAPDLPRDLIPGYDLIEEIHRGGQGVVYRAVQHGTKREVAIKMLLAGMFASDRQRLRFEIESELAATLRHPNIVTVHDRLALRGGRYALVMEYIRGVRLDRWPADQATAPERYEARLRLFLQVCDAVGHAHLRGVIHRDLKPSNILVDASGRAHLLDFGLAKALHETERRLTITGEAAWTLGYASPEQIDDPSRVDARADVYSLGVLLYELLSGSRPYDTDSCTIAQAMERVRSRQPDALGTRAADAGFVFPRDAKIVVATALEKDPAVRYQSVSVLAADIRALLEGGPISAREHSAWYTVRCFARRNRVWVVAGIAVAGLTLVAAVGLGVLSSRLASRGSQLETALRESNVRQARALITSENTGLGERMLYAELERTMGKERVNLRTASDGPPERVRAFWGLAQVMGTQPCARTIRLPPPYRGPLGIRYTRGSDSTATTVEVLAVTSMRLAQLTWPDLSWIDELEIHVPEPIHSAWWLADGTLLAATLPGDALLMRSHVTGAWRQAEVPAECRPVSSLLTSTTLEGRSISVLQDGAVWRFGPDQPARILRPSCDEKGPYGTRVAPDGKSWWTVACDGWSFEQRSIETGVLLRTIPGPPVPAVVTTRNINILIVVTASMIFSTADSKWMALRLDQDPPEWISSAPLPGSESIVPSPDGSRVATYLAHQSPTIALWETHPPSPPRVIRGHVDNISSVAWAPDLRSCTTVDHNGVVRVWHADPMPWSRSLPGPSPETHQAVFLGDGSVIVAHGTGEVVRCAEGAESAEQIFKFAKGTTVAQAIDFNSMRAAAVSLEGSVAVFSLPGVSTAPPKVLDGAANQLSSCVFSPTGKRLAVAGVAPDLAIYNAETLERVAILQDKNLRVATVVFSPDERWLAWRRGHDVVVWDVARGEEAAILSGHTGDVRSVRFLPDGKHLWSGGDDRMVRMWRVGSWELEQATTKTREAVFSMAIHPTGRLIFGGDRAGSVTVWDAKTGQDVATIPTGGAIVLGLDCSPDGRYLAVATSTAGAMVWDLSVFASMIELNRPIAVAAPDSRLAPAEMEEGR